MNNFNETYQDAQLKLEASESPLNILLIGSSGIGKSTFINSLVGKDVAKTGVFAPVSTEIIGYSIEHTQTTIYDSPGIELDEEKREFYKKQAINFIKDKFRLDFDKQIHVILFCIRPPRLQEPELDYLRSISEYYTALNVHIPIVIVNLRPYEAMEEQMQEFYQNTQKKFAQLFPDYKKMSPKYINKVHEVQAITTKVKHSTQEEFGITELTDYLLQILPDVLKNSILSSLRVDIVTKEEEAKRLVNIYSTTAGGTAIGSTLTGIDDSLALLALQIGMCAHIGRLYNFALDENRMKAMVTAGIGTTAVSAVGKTAAHFILAALTGGASLIVEGTIRTGIGFGLTEALGNSYIALMRKYALGELNDEQVTNQLAKMLLKKYNESKEKH